MKLRTLICLALLLFVSTTSFKPNPEEGMYPISLLGTLNFEEMGMELKANDIFNEKGNGLINAIVNINGCTGSFISDEGLILTNHHCIFSALKPHTTEEKNYMRDGYLAKDKTLELPMEDYKVRIMKSYSDVSKKVLEGVAGIESPVERNDKIRENIKAISKADGEKHPNLEVEISEMLAGSSYILFRYEYLKDIRLVYVPPRYIGEFGGETDNWMWPRHSGDFSFVRAYIGKDGKPAEYSEDNVPYTPDRYLQADFEGVKDADPVFILGYPGRTYRHYPAEFINYMEQVQMPYIADLWESQIEVMEALSTRSDALEIKYATRIKRKANVTKNYRGKLQSLRRIDLYNKKKSEEEMIYQLLAARKSEQPSKEFRSALNELNELYADLSAIGPKRFWYGQLTGASCYFEIASYLVSYGNLSEEERTKEAKKKYLRAVRSGYKRFDRLTDSIFVSKMLSDGLDYGIDGLKKSVASHNELGAFVRNAYSKAKIIDSAYVIKMMLKKPEKLGALKDPFVKIQVDIAEGQDDTYNKLNKINLAIKAKIPEYVNLKMKAKSEQFVPDANSTLRFTYGTVKGYTPRDATYLAPVTTVNGILEKGAKGGEYKLEEELKNAILNNNSGEFFREELGSVPVNLLYNTDTSGGNSGSPILNKSGKLIGLNFDRAHEACVNDFAWDDSYSRSIGVDIRYILWVTQNVGQANNLVDEIRNN